MARSLIRFSVNDEQNNATGLAVRATLEGGGFVRIGTGTFEANGPAPHALVATLRAALDQLGQPPGGGVLDHFWVYLDNPVGPN